MSTPISKTRIGATLLAGTLVLAACKVAQSDDRTGGASAAASAVQELKDWVKGVKPVKDDRPRIHCAIEAGAAMTQDCRLELVKDAVGPVLILSRPDGGFHRLRLGVDGAMSAADGAVDPRLARDGDIVGVAFETERYAVPLSLLKPSAK